jgi:DNA-binding GntR family transcriptional regulator
MISAVAQAKNVKLASQADRCAFEITQQIRDGALRPGQKIGEESVAKKLGIGRAPVRIAFERLVSAGVLRRVHRAGTFVRKIGLEEFCELSDVRAVLEGLAARLACERITAPELARLEEKAKAMDHLLPKLMKSPAPDWREIVQLEAEFHAEIARLSGNRLLPRILAIQDLIWWCFQMGVSLRMSETQEKHIPQHREVVRALGSGDPDLAERTLRDHILLAKEEEVLKLSGVRFRAAATSKSAVSASPRQSRTE